MDVCASCAAQLPSGARFCGSCGQPVDGSAIAATGPAPPPPPPRAPSTPSVLHVGGVTLPVELAVVIGLLWLAALLLFIPAVKVLPHAFDGFGHGKLGTAVSALLLIALTILIGAAATCAWLGIQLARADRVGRILTVALCAALAVQMLAADHQGTDEIIVLLCTVATIGILTMSPNVRAFLTGPASRQYLQPIYVVAARALAVYLAWALGIVGFAFLPVGSLAGKYYAIGAGLIAVSVVLYRHARRMSEGDPGARNVVSWMMVGYFVLLAISTSDANNMLLPLGLVAATLILLWVPEESKAYFSRAA
jgi:hypothetical protein